MAIDRSMRIVANPHMGPAGDFTVGELIDHVAAQARDAVEVREMVRAEVRRALLGAVEETSHPLPQ